MPRPLAACTIVSKNYLAFARVLARSFAEHHPEGRFFVLLVDRLDESRDLDSRNLADEPFDVVWVEDLPIPNLSAFLFRYTVLEANTAVKPFFLAHLFAEHDLANLVYFDPDIRILGPLDDLASLVEDHAIVLTPHLDQPVDDDAFPGEQAILQSGAYNLGFLALRAGETTNRLLAWWGDRLLDRCVVRPEEGLFVDQKWMDLAPGLFGDAHVLRDPGYNVAYWNLHGRDVSAVGTGAEADGDDGWRVNGRPLVFFHFSGIDPEHLEPVSKHQDRFVLADLGPTVDTLYRQYAEALFVEGHREQRGEPYAFGRFDNDSPIPDVVRAIFHEIETQLPAEIVADPFARFFDFLVEPSGRSGPRRRIHDLLFERWRSGRLDPKSGGGDFSDFVAWLREYGRHALRLPDALLGDLDALARSAGEPSTWTPAGLKRRAIHAARRAYKSDASRRLRESIKDRLGRERTRALKATLRPSKPPVAEPTLADPADWTVPGVRLVGYLDAETGMGEAARGIARALEVAEIPHSLHTLDLGVVARRGDDRFRSKPTSNDEPRAVNLFVVNADQVPAVAEHLGSDFLRGRRNVGLWLWELDTFPADFAASFAPFDEIWTPSTFCVDAIGAISPVPVRRLPLPVVAPEVTPDRARFDLPADAFVVLYVWNYLSVTERKNPWAAVKAFRRAFGDDPSKLLVLKSSQSDHAPEAHARLVDLARDAGNVRILDGYATRQDLDTLVASCDAYLSLHRSEGFGLTVAEAMTLEKPVVATGYSGVVDFLDVGTGYPVAYDLARVGENAAPYPADARWAEPDLDHAAAQLRRLAVDETERRRVAARGRRRVENELSLAAVGDVLRRRLAGLC